MYCIISILLSSEVKIFDCHYLTLLTYESGHFKNSFKYWCVLIDPSEPACSNGCPITPSAVILYYCLHSNLDHKHGLFM